ncbi:MAG: hypothetical protein V1907_02610 [Candidatus Kerfeldbacteria bacterium]
MENSNDSGFSLKPRTYPHRQLRMVVIVVYAVFFLIGVTRVVAMPMKMLAEDTGASGNPYGWLKLGSVVQLDTITDNVGIGTVTPAAKLDVVGDVRWSGSLLAGAVPWARLTGVPTFIGGSGTGNYLARFTAGTTIGNSSIFDNGNVGIGTTAPNNKLSIQADDNRGTEVGTGANTIVLTPRNTGQGNSPLIDLINGGPSGKRNIIMSTTRGLEFVDVSEDSAWIFRTNNLIERMRIDPSGNVGIGTTNPGAMLEVNDLSSTRPIGLYINRSNGAATGASPTLKGLVVTQQSANDTVSTIAIDATAAHNIGYGGNVAVKGTANGIVYDTGRGPGIGVYGIGNQAEINGAGTAIGVKGEATAAGVPSGYGYTYAGYFDNTATVGIHNYGLYIKTASAGTYGIYQTGSGINYLAGNVGIGTTSPAYKLDVNGDVGWSGSLLAGSVPWPRLTGVPTFIGGSGTNNYLAKFTAGTTITNSSIFDNGNVGIGTTSPGAKLDVAGTMNATGAASFGSDVNWAGTLTGGNVPWPRLTTFPAACPAGQYVSGVGSSLSCATLPASVSGSGTGGTTYGYISRFNGSTSIQNSGLYQNGSGIGINTTDPQYFLDVAGWARIEKLIIPQNTGALAFGNWNPHISADTNGNGGTDFNFWNTTSGNPAGKINFRSYDGGAFWMTIGNDGNVGINTTNPKSRLQVADGYIQIPTTTMPIDGDCDEASEYGRMTVFESWLMVCTPSSGWRGL